MRKSSADEVAGVRPERRDLEVLLGEVRDLVVLGGVDDAATGAPVYTSENAIGVAATPERVDHGEMEHRALLDADLLAGEVGRRLGRSVA